MLGPIVDRLTANQDIGNAIGIANLKNFSELLKSETVAHRSGPFCHCCRHLVQVGNLPFRPVTHERHLSLMRHGRPRTALPNDKAAALGFLRFDFAIKRNFHNENKLFRFLP